jgi:hypothetical protein
LRKVHNYKLSRVNSLTKGAKDGEVSPFSHQGESKLIILIFSLYLPLPRLALNGITDDFIRGRFKGSRDAKRQPKHFADGGGGHEPRSTRMQLQKQQMLPLWSPWRGARSSRHLEIDFGLLNSRSIRE